METLDYTASTIRLGRGRPRLRFKHMSLEYLLAVLRRAGIDVREQPGNSQSSYHMVCPICRLHGHEAKLRLHRRPGCRRPIPLVYCEVNNTPLHERKVELWIKALAGRVLAKKELRIKRRPSGEFAPWPGSISELIRTPPGI